MINFSKIVQLIKKKTASGKISSKIFIMPTRIGIYFFTTAVIQLLMGIVFTNNLILLFGLILLIFGILTAVITNFHLENIEAVDINISSGHSNSLLIAHIILNNKTSDQIFSGIDIEIHLSENQKITIDNLSLGPNINHSSSPFSLKRGSYNTKYITISTRYPFHLFQSWRNFKMPQKTFTIFPERLKKLPQNLLEEDAEAKNGRKSYSVEYSHSDKFQQGDNLNRIDWKIFARTGELYKKVFQENLMPQQKFILRKPVSEKSLQEISSLITHAYECGHQWELKGLEKKFPMTSGSDHYHNCQVYLSEKDIDEKAS